MRGAMRCHKELDSGSHRGLSPCFIQAATDAESVAAVLLLPIGSVCPPSIRIATTPAIGSVTAAPPALSLRIFDLGLIVSSVVARFSRSLAKRVCHEIAKREL